MRRVQVSTLILARKVEVFSYIFMFTSQSHLHSIRCIYIMYIALYENEIKSTNLSYRDYQCHHKFIVSTVVGNGLVSPSLSTSPDSDAYLSRPISPDSTASPPKPPRLHLPLHIPPEQPPNQIRYCEIDESCRKWGGKSGSNLLLFFF